ncbi:hypothetical protein K2173_008005 [Erythroxylum novogranatense]|uniref:Uncharacterized protein n=1 Tax=Erythroxylum novogranatense TaxID=1862640 RepID=A0AAV8T6Z8_9ROSI|nr:hypothetical protein K2173_008005 [Erythroxylum novogranatense]
MEIEVASPRDCVGMREGSKNKADKDRVHVKKKTLQAVLEECQRALELLSNAGGVDDDNDESSVEGKQQLQQIKEDSPGSPDNREADELCDLLKSRLECPEFLEKLECARISISKNTPDLEDYVLVRQEDIVEGIACFMAAWFLLVSYLKNKKFLTLDIMSLQDLTPNQLQEALSKTFSVKKKKGKLRKAWDGSKVIYNVASWGATAIGIYQNPVILRVASKAFLTSCHVISKLL